MMMPCDYEGYRRSAIILTMHHKPSGVLACRLSDIRQGDETCICQGGAWDNYVQSINQYSFNSRHVKTQANNSKKTWIESVS